jgi:hypothetical protein
MHILGGVGGVGVGCETNSTMLFSVIYSALFLLWGRTSQLPDRLLYMGGPTGRRQRINLLMDVTDELMDVLLQNIGHALDVLLQVINIPAWCMDLVAMDVPSGLMLGVVCFQAMDLSAAGKCTRKPRTCFTYCTDPPLPTSPSDPSREKYKRASPICRLYSPALYTHLNNIE